MKKIIILLTILITLTSCYLEKETIALENYNGIFRETLIQADEYLRKNHPIKNFKVVIYTGTKDRSSFPRTIPFLSSTIQLNEQHLANVKWKEDFNRVADAWNLPHLLDQHDNARFLLFHEYRHILQEKGLSNNDWHELEVTPERKRVIPAYRFTPKEADADWWGLKEVKMFKDIDKENL